MRRLSYERRLRQKRISAKRQRRKRKRQRFVEGFKWKSFHRITAPVQFRLLHKKHRSSLLKFLAKLRNAVMKGSNPNILIDFSNTESMWADGTLLFKAELDRLLRIFKEKRCLRCLPPKNKKVAQVLKQVDIFRLLKRRWNKKGYYKDVIYWRHANGFQVDGSKYKDILEPYDGVIPKFLADGFYKGITEAMTNCHHHAYMLPREDGLNQSNEPRAWWMFSQERDGFLTVVFCDLGVGIPKTFPINEALGWKKLFAKVGGPPSDGSVIEEAVESSRSRTGKAYRGKGIKQLFDTASESAGGMVQIFSNRGCYDFSNGKGTVHNFNDSILGTLIQWKAPLQSMKPVDL